MLYEVITTPDAKSLVYTMYGNSNTDIIQTYIDPLRSRMLVRMPGLNCGAAISPNRNNFV